MVHTGLGLGLHWGVRDMLAQGCESCSSQQKANPKNKGTREPVLENPPVWVFVLGLMLNKKVFWGGRQGGLLVRELVFCLAPFIHLPSEGINLLASLCPPSLEISCLLCTGSWELDGRVSHRPSWQVLPAPGLWPCLPPPGTAAETSCQVEEHLGHPATYRTRNLMLLITSS